MLSQLNIQIALNFARSPFDINGRKTYDMKINDTTTYIFSSPTIQMADSSFTTSVIMEGWVGSMALASRARHFSSPRILSKPYCRTHKPECRVILTTCRCEAIKQFHLNALSKIKSSWAQSCE